MWKEDRKEGRKEGRKGYQFNAIQCNIIRRIQYFFYHMIDLESSVVG